MKKMIDYKNVRKIGLVARLNTDLSNDILTLKRIFDKRGIELLLEKNCVKSLNLGDNGVNLKAQNSNSSPKSVILSEINSKAKSLNSSQSTQNSRAKPLNLNNQALNSKAKSVNSSFDNVNFSGQNAQNSQITSTQKSVNLKSKTTENSQIPNTQTTHFQGFELDELFTRCDFIISLGGDGTLISLCRKASEYDKALLGIHAGRLGFLTDFTIDEAEAFFDEFFAGKFRVEEPFLLDIILESKQGQVFEKTAFNDVVFSRTQKHSMAHIEVLRNGKTFNEYYGDGLIVASAAGSTAYNLSANGPIIYTLAEVFLLTPVCSHSLTQRPIVLPKGFELEVRAKECSFFIDGQECLDTRDFASIRLRLSDKKVRLIHPKNRDYFQILKEKLRWGN